MKFVFALFLSFYLSLLHGQNCLDFSQTSMDIGYLAINPAWIKKNKIKKVIEKEYLGPKPVKAHLVNALIYNDSGYIEKMINGVPDLSDPSANKNDFTSLVLYEYEMIDSFLYQKETIIRNFDENGRLASGPDTLLPFYKGIYNIYLKKYQTHKGEKLTEYSYDEENKLLNIKHFQNYGKNIQFKYDKGQLLEIEVTWESKQNLPFIHDERINYKYNAQGWISESNIRSQPRMNRYFYDRNGAMVKKEMYWMGKLKSTLTYEFIQ